MATKIEICNRALGLVGAKRIMTLNEDNNRAQACADMYDLARDISIEARQWSFAYKQVVLAPSAIKPGFGFRNKFQIPGNTMRIIRADDAPDFSRDVYWEMDDGFILCDSDVMYTQLTYRADEASFSAAFAIALSYRLAGDICTILSNNNTLTASLLELWDAHIDIAASTDGMQGKRTMMKANRLVGARSSGSVVGGGIW